ncbi:DALR 1 domain containing protein [Trichuris trichiura]|uniref:DALR 1 domain containing protein n=1 Tax=Trichuris trichiura TaxID=36087 RepID=A0A077Z0S1_TRITR|nr:DALR 1 domain containing protein [Trichuris trichiura]
MKNAMELLNFKIENAEQDRTLNNGDVIFFGAVFSDWIDSRAITGLRTLLLTRCLCKIAESIGVVAHLMLPIPGEFEIIPGCTKIYQSWQTGFNVLRFSPAGPSPLHSTDFSSLLASFYEHVKTSDVIVVVYPEFWSTCALELRTYLQSHNMSVISVVVGNVQVNSGEFFPITDYIRTRLKQVEELQERRRLRAQVEREASAIRLCACVITFELLLPRARKPISVNLNPSYDLPDRSKRGIFVMYNYARIDSILRRFMNGLFPPIPELSALPTECFLKNGQFANLVENILHSQPFAEDLMRSVLRSTKDCPLFAEPRLCLQLAEFSNSFSKVYNKVQILPPRSDMVTPGVYFKIHVLRVINKWMLHLFKLLSLQEVVGM